MFGILNIKGTVLDRCQLERYMEKLASDNILQNKSEKETYPIPRLLNNFKFITKVYNLLNEHLKLGINIHPAGEWLLDNYYVIEENVKTIQKELSLKKYINFLGLDNGMYKGYARIYVLAGQMVAYTENCINRENLVDMLKAYQNKKSLSMDEIWNIGMFLQIAIIENISGVCEKIYSSQMQKYKVENIVERLVELKPKENQIFRNECNYKTQKFGFKEMKYPFIEYMSYKLKKSRKKAYNYLNILEEQVNKMGTTISEVIKKEHFDIAYRKVLMGNSITSMKTLLRMNFLEIFEKINGVEEILKKDPANVYTKMDYKTKEYYRNEIKEISKKTKISEIYIANKLIELASKEINNTDKETHIGYYLISEGKKELLNKLAIKDRSINFKKETKVKLYISSIICISIFISILIGNSLYYNTNLVCAILIGLISFIPITEISTQIIQYILSKIVKPRIIPKLDFLNGISEKESTFVIIPTIINSTEKIKQLISKLETYYLANKTDNLYFAILADCVSSDKKIEDIDEELIKIGKEEINKLNEKYKDINFHKFHFLYRKRKWNASEKIYLGWERKRGLINQFNDFLLNMNNSDFIANTILECNMNIPKIKYIITLDADTDLVLNSGFELIGAMAHILNTPIIDKKRNVVIDGYGVIQPKVGINLDASRKSLFTRIYAGAGGTDSYTNAISDVYQDNFGEGIFAGKGIYDLEIFSKVLKNQMPENIVLSHDLLEGNYLRCGLASDILLMDGYPYKYNSFMSRLSRWIRGDWQIIGWLKNKIIDENGNQKENPLNKLSKFKILDNLRRSIIEVFISLMLIFSLYLHYKYKINIWWLITIAIGTLILPGILEILNKIIFKKDGEKKQKTFCPIINGIKGSVLRGILNISFFPDKAYISINSILKTIYRMSVTKQNLLEWTTSEEAEKNAKTDYKSYYIGMKSNIFFSIITVIISFYSTNNISKVIYFLFSIIWIIAPAIACYISKENIKVLKINQVSEENKKYILEIGEKTWTFFKDIINKENNFLPPDNYQEDRNPKFVNRTSSTNIGLGLLTVVSAYDLKYENLEYTITLLEKMLTVIDNLAKWNGHLYNWYNIQTLEPLIPRYISTVDSGNFIGYLYVLKQFLIQTLKNNQDYIDKINNMISIIDNLIKNTDFTILYDEKTRLFSIGFNVEENRLTDSYYDLLASEARQASLVAIAQKQIPAKHWNNLSRTLTTINRYKGLVSWSGTAFEYLMPNINIIRYEGSLLDESCKFMIMSQKEYSKKLGIPWGMSESAFNIKDLNSNYQYKAFGIPWLGLKRGLEDEIVISGYGSVLAITDEPNNVIKNIKELEKVGAIGKYGIYEAIDYTISRLKYGEKQSVVKTFMAHHQGLILLSINNLFNDNILQKRFSNNPEIQAVDILLQERMPENVIITKEKKEKPEKLKYKDYENYTEKVYTKIDENFEKCNVISNEDYTVVTTQRGEGYSKYKNIYVNRFKETSDIQQGIFFYIKNIRTKRIWTSNYIKHLSKPDKYKIHYMSDTVKIDRIDGNIETITKTVIAPNKAVEIRNLEIRNNGTEEETLEVTGYFEPILSSKEQDIAHMTFNNLFLRYNFIEDTNSILITRKQRDKNVENIYLGVSLYTENETIGDLEYEVDKEKFYSRGNLGIPEIIENSKPFSKSLGLITDPLIALKRTIKIKPNEKIVLNLIITVSNKEDIVKQNLKDYTNSQKIERIFEVSKARAAEEARYLDLKGKDIETYQDIMSLLMFKNPIKKLYMNKYANSNFSQESLWRFGISGDFPILLVKIKDVNDVYVVEDALKAYEYLKLKNIYIELVILDEEKYSYETYVKEEVENAILNRHLAYMKNIRSGIFFINSNELSKEDKELLKFKANLIIDSHLGNLKSQIEEMEEEYLNNIKNIGNIEEKQIILPEEKIRSNNLDRKDTMDNLKYYNEYGAFSNDGKEYIIKVNKENNVPTVWSHILANENFGTLLTEGMGGYTWNRNSRLNRISSWNNNPLLDIPSEIIYLKDMKNNKAWSLGSRPMPDDNDYYITYGLGYAKYEHISLGIIQELDVFVPMDDNVKINIINLKNTTPEKRKLKLLYYIKPVLEDDELKSNGNIYVNKNTNLVYAKNLYSTEFKNEIVYISSSEEIKSFTGNKDFFIGTGTIQNPDAIKKVSLDNETGLGMNSCIALELEIELESYERKEISLILGQEESLIDVKNIAYKYGNISNCKQELSKTKQYWYNLINNIQIKTPLESVNILLNGWIPYQTICSRIWGKTGYYQSGGATGFRDQLQDTIGLKYIDIEFMKNQIILNCKHQFIEGDVEHWWHEETQRGIRTRFSDDLLWLPYVVLEYIRYTSDENILDLEIPYLEGKLLDENQIEKYDIYNKSDIKESVYNHCIKAIEKSLNFGENGLPKIGSGDWNDGFSEVGIKNKGESVWLGFFLYDILNKFIPIINKKQNYELQDKYEQIKQNLKIALNKNAWDGRWYKRAFMDNGDVLGSIENEECRIDSIAQSWSVISTAGDNDKKFISMESLENHLVDKQNGIIKLLDPPFNKSKLEPGYIKAYLPGVRENGGQYTHECCCCGQFLTLKKY